MERTSVNLIEQSNPPAIFGLRYLEEEAAEIHDVVGCLMTVNSDITPRATFTGCDDSDSHPHYLI